MLRATGQHGVAKPAYHFHELIPINQTKKRLPMPYSLENLIVDDYTGDQHETHSTAELIIGALEESGPNKAIGPFSSRLDKPEDLLATYFDRQLHSHWDLQKDSGLRELGTNAWITIV